MNAASENAVASGSGLNEDPLNKDAVMQEFHGNLSIGGLQLQHLHGELESDQALPDSTEHLLSGRLSVPPSQKEQLEFGRRYRLEIEDGPAGPVVVSRIESERENEVILEFQPPAGKPR